MRQQLQLLQLFMTLLGSSWLLDEKIDQITIIFAVCVVIVVAIGRRMPVEKTKDLDKILGSSN